MLQLKCFTTIDTHFSMWISDIQNGTVFRSNLIGWNCFKLRSYKSPINYRLEFGHRQGQDSCICSVRVFPRSNKQQTNGTLIFCRFCNNSFFSRESFSCWPVDWAGAIERSITSTRCGLSTGPLERYTGCIRIQPCTKWVDILYRFQGRLLKLARILQWISELSVKYWTFIGYAVFKGIHGNIFKPRKPSLNTECPRTVQMPIFRNPASKHQSEIEGGFFGGFLALKLNDRIESVVLLSDWP